MAKPTFIQKEYLKFRGIGFDESLTKAQASKLIGKASNSSGEEDRQAWFLHRETLPTPQQVELFELFGLDPGSVTQPTEQWDTLLEDKDNKEKWKDYKRKRAEQKKKSPPTVEQKNILKFFEVKKRLNTTEAKVVIEELLSDPANAAKWEREEELLDSIEGYYDWLDTETLSDLYDCKKISRKRFDETIQALRLQGYESELIKGDAEEAIVNKAIEMYPELAKKGYVSPSTVSSKSNRSGCSSVVVFGAVGAAVVHMMLR
jgi:hypothetical protein